MTTQITELPDNEFYYVFDQFNHIIVRMNEMFDEALKEQELRMQAELEQLHISRSIQLFFIIAFPIL